MSLGRRWAELTGKGLPQGVWKFDGQGPLAHHRFHLRVDSNQKGMLIIDAAHLVKLNGTALDYVRCLLEGRSEESMYSYMSHRYKNLDRATASSHYVLIREQLEQFLRGDADVVNIIGSDQPTKGADDYPAPYRMDLVLTYRCQNSCGHCYNEPRELTELSAEQWHRIIARTWKLGIPHIIFTGGEPTMVPFLGDLIARSEEYGQVTGLVTNGRNLQAPGYLNGLVTKGLDHVQITVLSHREEVHDRLAGCAGAWKETIEGLKMALKEDLYVSTNTTIMSSNLEDMEGTARFLLDLGVKNISFNSIIRSGKGVGTNGVDCAALEKTLIRMKELVEGAGARIIWFTPTPYCELNPVNLGLGIKQCTACSLNMAVEPDGTVLPCQSYYRPLGNILRDQWANIWNHELCKEIRSRGFLDEECSKCAMVDTCGGGCPLAREHGDYSCLNVH
ncbi:MAG: radical SAM protein [Methanomassiliicoccus sp.]|nr:radical SAM protein [Methanomassiliicoccus sp.]